MKNYIKKVFIAAIALVLTLASCSKDDGPESKPEIVLSSAKVLTSFTFSAVDNATFSQNVIASINEDTKAITANLPSDTNVTALSPTFVVSAKASVTPTGTQDFTNPVTYTVTAEDGTKATYTAEFNSNSSTKQITSFVFLLTNNVIDDNVVGVIDEEAKTITATMPSGTNIKGLLPEIVVSENAVVNSNSAQDFTNSITYTVTAEDGSEVIYTVTITKLLTQKEILQTILDANPNFNYGWDLSNTADSDLGALGGVLTNIDGNIINMYFENAKIIKIPVEIGELIHLTQLGFPYNEITTIPTEISNLTSLKKLDLNDNEITTIPTEIGTLTGLKSLRLDRNKLTTLPTEIGTLTNLEYLNLKANKLTTIPTEIGNLANLEKLYLDNNELATLPTEIGNLVNLKSLQLYSNQLHSIPLELGNLTKLEYLGISGNELTEIPTEIGFLINLIFLRIRETSLNTIPQAICNLEIYNELEIAKDDNVACETVSQKDALISIYSANPNNTLGWSVDNFPGVTFNAEGNPTVFTMHDKNLERLPDTINFLEDLEVIAANGNQLTTVPSVLSQLSKLVLLTIEDNPISNIPQSVCNQQVSNGGVLTIVADSGEGCD